MKNFFFLSLILLIPFLAFTQNVYHNSQKVGLNLMHSENTGLYGEVSYSHPLSKWLFVKVRFNSNVEHYTGGSLGVGCTILLNKTFDINFGAEYELGVYPKNRYSEHKEITKNIIIPVELNYHINDKILLSVGINSAINNNNVYGESKWIDNLKVGIGFKF